MSCQSRLAEWTPVIRTHWPMVSQPQATVLALWRLGMGLARSCALTAVAVCLAAWLNRKEQSVRQQLREFCDEADAKRGAHRQALVVEDGLVPLLRWVLNPWRGTPLALALEATTLGLRFPVLALRVVYRGCAIPVAWTLLPANTKHAWRHAWLRLLRQLRPAIPRDGTVLVLAARGLDAGWLLRRLVRLGWHPFWRITAGGPFRPDPQATFRPLASFVPSPGTRWRGPGTAFKSPQRRLRCPLVACWEDGSTDPWLLLTDVPPEASEAGGYGLRAGIEPGVKVTKRAGWQWQRTRMTNPQRAARWGLAVAVATLWLRSVGGASEATMPASTLLDGTAVLMLQRRQRRATRLRLVSSFRRGWVLSLVALLRQAPLPLGTFLPEPWPPVPMLDQTVIVTPVGVYHDVAA
jgi:hypothetical protein